MSIMDVYLPSLTLQTLFEFPVGAELEVTGAAWAHVVMEMVAVCRGGRLTLCSKSSSVAVRSEQACVSRGLTHSPAASAVLCPGVSTGLPSLPLWLSMTAATVRVPWDLRRQVFAFRPICHCITARGLCFDL